MASHEKLNLISCPENRAINGVKLVSPGVLVRYFSSIYRGGTLLRRQRSRVRVQPAAPVTLGEMTFHAADLVAFWIILDLPLKFYPAAF